MFPQTFKGYLVQHSYTYMHTHTQKEKNVGFNRFLLENIKKRTEKFTSLTTFFKLAEGKFFYESHLRFKECDKALNQNPPKRCYL